MMLNAIRDARNSPGLFYWGAISIPLHSSKNNFSCFQNNLTSKKIFFRLKIILLFKLFLARKPGFFWWFSSTVIWWFFKTSLTSNWPSSSLPRKTNLNFSLVWSFEWVFPRPPIESTTKENGKSVVLSQGNLSRMEVLWAQITKKSKGNELCFVVSKPSKASSLSMHWNPVFCEASWIYNQSVDDQNPSKSIKKQWRNNECWILNVHIRHFKYTCLRLVRA